MQKNPESEDVRVVFDASNGVYTNHRIKVRDQLRSPTAPDCKAILGAAAAEGGPHCGGSKRLYENSFIGGVINPYSTCLDKTRISGNHVTESHMRTNDKVKDADKTE